jgi:GDPmannose 4,6-dehydratase
MDAQRDWGHAKDYVEAMWLMLQQDKPEDYVIATGITTPVREFVRMSFAEAGIEIEFRGKGVKEIGVVKRCINPEYHVAQGAKILCVDERYFRPTEVDILRGNATKAKKKLGWSPTYTLNEIIKEMVAFDIDCFKKEKHLINSGFLINSSIEH